MLPEWQARWQRSLAHWSGDISLMVGDETFTLRIKGSDLRLLVPSTTVKALLLTPQAFTQLVFGYYPAAESYSNTGIRCPVICYCTHDPLSHRADLDTNFRLVLGGISCQYPGSLYIPYYFVSKPMPNASARSSTFI